ncbi:glycosyltransferase family 4 protein [Trichocoleus sp. FACHB-262]|uniref:glycosyltransferase family 4 protein n=1 Tax=Trichocoleus sp. FACHB-262 TaxID=2692869 RepID=UPI001688B5F1|nr:glycosyltransferase family 4 protein [Trichocoleus sp. FACHB-262]MBD2121174.1 glycosyltransferase family 4 protein [Trichocoleus sp. FACHB-262]
MKISILTPDLSHNCLGRAHLLAKILQRQYEVEIVGPMFSNKIWEPLADMDNISYSTVRISDSAIKNYYRSISLVEKISGDVVYASKPLFTSYGLGILAKLTKNKSLVLDIDDWQFGLAKEAHKNSPSLKYRLKNLVTSAVELYSIYSYWNHAIGEQLTWLAQDITVSNNFLQEKFGGTIIWHARDANAFKPDAFDKVALKEKFGLKETQKVVMFLGTPRPHKGLDDLVEAIAGVDNPNALLVIVGLDKDTYSQKLVKLAESKLVGKFRAFGMQSFDKIPEFLAIADVVVIPQRYNSATVGQVPAKVFDAMAMAKPTISTTVSDLPYILEGCGWLVEPEQPHQLATSIQFVLDNPDEAQQIGEKAREKFITSYSWSAMEKNLTKIFKQYE